MEKTLKQLRQEAGITQRDMSLLLDMSYQNYVNYERGYYKSMPENVRILISDVLGIDFAYKREDKAE